MRTDKALIHVGFPVNARSENTKSFIKKKSDKIMLSSKCCHFVKNIFSVSNIFMQMFKVSTLCMRSIRCQRQNICYKLNSSFMHYMYLRTQVLMKKKSEKWLRSKCCRLSKKISLVSNIFMQMYNVSPLCKQSIRMFLKLILEELNSSCKHFLSNM